MKQAVIAIVVVVAIIGGAVVFGKDKKVTGEKSNHIYGNSESSVKLVEYGDFECSACGAFFPVISEVKEKYKDQISFQFKHFPLVQIHRNALAAHRAAEAAGKQDKFWEMHDLIYQSQEEWNGPSQSDPVGIPVEQAIALFESYATQLELDIDQFKVDVEDATTLATINADTAEGKSDFQISGTPGFVLNGKKIDDIASIGTVESFSAMIDEALGINTEELSPSQPAEVSAPSETTTVPTTPTTEQ